MNALYVIIGVVVALIVGLAWALCRLAAWADRADQHDEDPS